MKNFNEIFEEACPTFNNKTKLNKGSHFYHVTSHSFNDENIYNFTTATYRHNLLFNLCKKHNCILLLDVIKPTHSHELLMCKKFEDIQPIIKNVNAQVSRIIKAEKPKKYSIKGMHVFRESPSYTAVTNHVHLLYLVKYLWSNCQELINRGKTMPYSCFEQIENGFSKSYNIPLLEELFQMPFSETLKLCRELTNEQFLTFCEKKYKDFSEKEENAFFLSKND